MIWRIWLLVMLILMVGLPAPADAEVLCAKPSGSVFVRSQCKNNEVQVGPVSLVSGGGTGWELVTSEVTIGADEFGVFSCPPGKFVVNGGVIGFIDVPGSDEPEPRLVPVPGPIPNGTGWTIQGSPGNTADVWAICVNP
jgi:hypothetical protein